MFYLVKRKNFFERIESKDLLQGFDSAIDFPKLLKELKGNTKNKISLHGPFTTIKEAEKILSTKVILK